MLRILLMELGRFAQQSVARNPDTTGVSAKIDLFACH
jgi:hypothetical protein